MNGKRNKRQTRSDRPKTEARHLRVLQMLMRDCARGNMVEVPAPGELAGRDARDPGKESSTISYSQAITDLRNMGFVEITNCYGTEKVRPSARGWLELCCRDDHRNMDKDKS